MSNTIGQRYKEPIASFPVFLIDKLQGIDINVKWNEENRSATVTPLAGSGFSTDSCFALVLAIVNQYNEKYKYRIGQTPSLGTIGLYDDDNMRLNENTYICYVSVQHDAFFPVYYTVC